MILTLRPRATPTPGGKFVGVIEYDVAGTRGESPGETPRSCAQIAKADAAIACARFLRRLPVTRLFDVVVEN